MFTDKNVVLHDGEDMENSGDHDMRNSMLLTIYLNMSAAYIQANHYTLALQVLDEAENACGGKAGSQIYYRRSQAITSNLASTLDDLRKAKAHIEQAINLFQYEKIHKQKPKILHMLNLDNCLEAYNDQAKLVMKRLEERREWEVFSLKRKIMLWIILRFYSNFLEVEVDVVGGGNIKTRIRWRNRVQPNTRKHRRSKRQLWVRRYNRVLPSS